MLKIILIALGITVVVIAIALVISEIINRKKKLNSKERFVHDLLPELDCGKCGFSTCEEFSKSVSDEKIDVSHCPYIQRANLSKIKRVIKKGYYNNSNLVAFVRCKGGKDCKQKFEYRGQNYCWCKDSLHSGNKECDKACLGCGDCVRACRYGAIFINDKGVAQVDRFKCTGCGACTYACPNKLIVRVPIIQKVGVVCNNFDEKMSISQKCKVGCTSCGLCARNCPTGAISMIDGQPVVDSDKCIECHKCVGICPNKCISRL